MEGNTTPMTLMDTISLMSSEDWKDRLKAEYHQVKIRKNGLERMIAAYNDGSLSFQPKSPLPLLLDQREIMDKYMLRLEWRAEFEGIDLT